MLFASLQALVRWSNDCAFHPIDFSCNVWTWRWFAGRNASILSWACWAVRFASYTSMNIFWSNAQALSDKLRTSWMGCSFRYLIATCTSMRPSNVAWRVHISGFSNLFCLKSRASIIAFLKSTSSKKYQKVANQKVWHLYLVKVTINSQPQWSEVGDW